MEQAVMAPNCIQLLTLKELATMLKVSKVTLYRMLGKRSNPLPSLKIGHLRRFELPVVLAWFERQPH